MNCRVHLMPPCKKYHSTLVPCSSRVLDRRPITFGLYCLLLLQPPLFTVFSYYYIFIPPPPSLFATSFFYSLLSLLLPPSIASSSSYRPTATISSSGFLQFAMSDVDIHLALVLQLIFYLTDFSYFVILVSAWPPLRQMRSYIQPFFRKCHRFSEQCRCLDQ